MDDHLLQQYYPDGAPIIIQVAFKYGYGPPIIELNKKVYFNKNLSLSPQIMEAIQGICLSSCENQYCTIMHARGMLTHGFSLNDVKRLVDLQRLPESVPEKEKWENALRRIAVIFREPHSAPFLYRSLREFNTDKEIQDIAGVVAFALLHKFLLEFYDHEIDIADERILFKTVDCGEELISYFSDIEKNSPVFVMCCICKDLKGKEEWLPIERVVLDLPKDAIFSHGLCPRCVQRWKDLV